MLLDQPSDSPFDLKFRLFRVPVRVHPFFWLGAVFLGFDYLSAGFEYLLVWVACVFFSILLHEFGHVWMGHIFGTRGHILLQGLGGLAVGASAIHGRWKRIAVYLAGPGIQLLFFAALFATLLVIDKRPVGFGQQYRNYSAVIEHLDQAGFTAARLPNMAERFMGTVASLVEQPGWPNIVQAAVRMLLSINLWWAIINLIPIWPLDGGQIARELFTWHDPYKGTRNSLALSVAVGLVMTINALSAVMNGPSLMFIPVLGKLSIFLFGIMTFNCFLMLQAEAGRLRGGGYRDPDDNDRLPWERDPDEWKQG